MIALALYNLLLFVLSPVILGYWLMRLSKGKEDRAHWRERWGNLPAGTLSARSTGPRFWLHAVSVGELFAAKPVLRELRRRFPDALIVVSTTTPGGREVALKEAPQADAVIYYPLDFPFAVRRALHTVRPDVILLMEWEIWPNFLTTAKRLGARILVVNGRISDRGLRRGLNPAAAFFTAPGLAAVDLFAMQSAEDARRAPLVGAEPARVQTVGNTKFDESPAPVTPAEIVALRADLGLTDATVWVCGSTRNAPSGDPTPDEEAQIATAYQQARTALPGLQLILAPRHLDRADAIVATLEAAGLRVRRRSRGVSPPAPSGGALPVGGNVPLHPVLDSPSPLLPGAKEATANPTRSSGTLAPAAQAAPPEGAGGENVDVLLLDTFGELARVYAVADVAFVGGSLVRQGGQSVFQPLAQGVPALFGPYMNNQRDIAALALAEGVGFEVADAAALAAAVVRIVGLPEGERAEIGRRARLLIERNQGVSGRCVEAAARLWEERRA